MKLKQIYCSLFKKHPSRQYATIEQLIKAEKDHLTIAVESCLSCGKVIRKKGK